MLMHTKSLSWLAALSLAACQAAPAPVGLANTPNGDGPVILFDLETRPIPDIPFPNDLATRPDPTSPTGKRLNASLLAPTEIEASTRRLLGRLDGFGTYAPISVSFDAPLDLEAIKARHFQDPPEASDDVAYVVNIDAQNATCGQAVPLDLGQGNFPLLLPELNAYFSNDYRGNSDNNLFEDVEEDLNQNGTLDPGEDSDFDGVLDHPNTISTDERGRPNGDPRDDLASFFERETNTLILRPMVPLEEESTYAVILTKRLVDREGNPILSPFPFINHTDQTDELRALLAEGFCGGAGSILGDLGLNFSEANGGDVAFTWTFTTQSVTRDLVSIRDGLYGEGPFSYLADQFSTDGIDIAQLIDQGTPGENLFVLPSSRFVPLVSEIGPGLGLSPEQVAPLQESLNFVDFFVLGTFTSPNFMADPETGEVGYLDEEGREIRFTEAEIVRRSFDIDYQTGRAGSGRDVGADKGTFLLSIPKKTPGNEQKPFPVIFYGHGYGGSRIESLGFVGQMARHGFAVVAIESLGHGLALDPGQEAGAFLLFSSFGLGGVWDALINGRDHDLNGDGIGDPGADFFTGYLFHTRDNVRQTIIDFMQMVRVVRSFDGVRRWPFDLDGDGQNELAGDFDADGVVDLGGPENRYYTMGQSLNGIMSMILAGAEPVFRAAAPISGGGGLIDLASRSLQGGVREATILRAVGPLYLGLPREDGRTDLAVTLPDLNDDPTVTIATFSTTPRPGELVRITNQKTGQQFQAGVTNEGRFRVGIAADKNDPLLLEILAPDGSLRTSITEIDRDVSFQRDDFAAGSPLVALADGFGVTRNSPALRRFTVLAQTIVEPGDPINYAPHVFLDPLYAKIGDKELGRFSRPGQGTPIEHRILVLNTVGDTAVPVATGNAYARAAGVLDFRNPDPRYSSLEDDESPGVTANGLLIRAKVHEGVSRLARLSSGLFSDNRALLADPDDLDQSSDCFPEYCLSASCQNLPTVQICQGAPGTFLRAPQFSDLRDNQGQPLPPLRATLTHGDNRLSALRLAYVRPKGVHAIQLPEPFLAFDMNTFVAHLIGQYFRTDAASLDLNPCLEDISCPDIAQTTLP
jgi:hypothetical protein